MTCAEAREALLEAEMSALRGEGDTPLALHLRGCRTCRRLSEAVLRGEGLLANELTRAVPPLDVERILGPVPWRGRKRRPWYHRPLALPLVPLAAAAVLVAIFLTREPSLPGPAYSPPAPFSGPDVVVPEGKTAAVMATSNPYITVIWLF
jgi:predicted anti-sigma-YlaC factor YlaD